MTPPTTTADMQRYWTPTPADLPRVRAVAEHYWDSAMLPHRAWAIAALQQLSPVTSVLDLGCQCGPNLRLIREWFPETRLVGVDCNPHALAYGREWLPDAHFVDGAIPQVLTRWVEGTFDVVLSTYCLAYQSPDTILEAVRECLRLASTAVVLIEPMPNPEPDQLVVDGEGGRYVEWRHPYTLLVAQLVMETGIGRAMRWEPMAPYDTLTGALIITPAEAR